MIIDFNKQYDPSSLVCDCGNELKVPFINTPTTYGCIPCEYMIRFINAGSAVGKIKWVQFWFGSHDSDVWVRQDYFSFFPAQHTSYEEAQYEWEPVELNYMRAIMQKNMMFV